MSDQRLRDLGAHIEDTTPMHAFDDLERRARRRVEVRRTGILAAVVAVAVVAGIGATQIADRDRQTGPSPIDRTQQTPPTQGPIPAPTPTPVKGEPVLHLQSWGGEERTPVDLAVYADGRVIWGHNDEEGLLQMRLTREGIEWLQARSTSTGLFERDLALGMDDTSGNMRIHRGDRSVLLAWGQAPGEVAELGMQDQFLAATESQADELIELEQFLRDPDAWALPPRMFERREPSQFIPTHLWVSWDRSTPDPSRLPSPAREVLTQNLEPVLDGSCGVITLVQAQRMVQAMEQVGHIESDDVNDGIAFTMPGEHGPSFLHAHPSLPHDTGPCD